jgi:ribosomal protein S18 acetylase RimI-like enzyme
MTGTEIGQDQPRQAIAADIPAIVEIHQAAFADAFLTRLGSPFLRKYYQAVLSYHGGILLVSQGQAGLKGFVAGFLRPREFYRGMRQSRWTFVGPTIWALVRDPSLFARVIYNVRRIGKSAPNTLSNRCELSSIAVRPDCSGKGVGTRLANAFLEQAWAKGAQCVYLTTDARANDATNMFYGRLGFQVRKRFEQYHGRLMNEYVIDRVPQLALDGRSS